MDTSNWVPICDRIEELAGINHGGADYCLWMFGSDEEGAWYIEVDDDGVAWTYYAENDVRVPR